MTEETRTATVNKMIDAAKHDEAVRKKYLNNQISTAVIYSLIALAYVIFYSVIHATCKPKVFAGWLFGLIFLDIFLTTAMLFSLFGNRYKLHNGKKCNTPLGILLQIICFFDALVPMMYLVYYFNYDVSTDTCGISIWKIMLIAPLLYAGFLVMGAFMNTTGSYSTNTDAKGNEVMTKLDWWRMRQEQEIAGIDPDKMPIVLSPSQIKKMTKSDWYSLAVDLEIAGYDVFKKH